jgi:hypothetical protein
MLTPAPARPQQGRAFRYHRNVLLALAARRHQAAAPERP